MRTKQSLYDKLNGDIGKKYKATDALDGDLPKTTFPEAKDILYKVSINLIPPKTTPRSAALPGRSERDRYCTLRRNAENMIKGWGLQVKAEDFLEDIIKKAKGIPLDDRTEIDMETELAGIVKITGRDRSYYMHRNGATYDVTRFVKKNRKRMIALYQTEDGYGNRHYFLIIPKRKTGGIK